jgi:hypothetical protein
VIILEQSNLVSLESLRTVIKEEIELFEKIKLTEREEKYNIEFDRHVKVTTIFLLIMSVFFTVLISFFTNFYVPLIINFFIIYPFLVVSSYFILKSKKKRSKKEVWLFLNFLIFLLVFLSSLVLFFFL